MKRYAIWAMAVAVVAAASCTKETEVIAPEAGKQIEFHAVWADDPGTRTVLQSDGTSVWWTPGEEINAFYGNKFSGKFTSTNTSNQELVSFQGTLTVLTGTAETGNEASAYWAVYPYDASNMCDGQSVTLTVPDVQTAKEGTFADKFFPSVATSQSLDLAFYNVCGGVRFSVSQSGIVSVTFKAVGNEPLVGKARVGFGADGVPEVKGVTEGNSEVTVYAPDGGFVPDKYYFAAFLPQTLSQGLSMTFKTMSHFATYSTGSNITVNRSRFGKLDEKDKDLTFVSRPDVPVESVSLDRQSANLAVGKQVTLIATIAPENATDKSVIWSSSDESIASVSSTGVVTGVAVGSAIITVRAVDGGKSATCSVFVKEVLVPEAVDLGLPSGLKWASFNLGASKPEEYGDYYAWGETEPYYSNQDPLTWKAGKSAGYDWPSYKWCKGSNTTMIKYCPHSYYGYNDFTDTKTVLDFWDDAAHVNLGGKWRMPTDTEWTELRDRCAWEATYMNGIYGRKVTGPNGNSIFLPAAGSRNNTSLGYVGSYGYYWSSSLHPDELDRAWDIFFFFAYVSKHDRGNPRCFGLSIRPVTE